MEIPAEHVEKMEEIMADKLISLVDCDRYIRYRDIWDLQWLKQKNVLPNMKFVSAKIEDYAITNYVEKLNNMKQKLPDITASSAFKDQLSRFIPTDIRAQTLDRPQFATVLTNTVSDLLQTVQSHISDN